MRPSEIKAELVRREITQRKISKICNASFQHVHNIIAGRRKNKYIQRKIAKAINLPYEDVWGDAA